MGYKLCKKCGQPILKKGQVRKNRDEYRHATGCPDDDFPRCGARSIGGDVCVRTKGHDDVRVTPEYFPGLTGEEALAAAKEVHVAPNTFAKDGFGGGILWRDPPKRPPKRKKRRRPRR